MTDRALRDDERADLEAALRAALAGAEREHEGSTESARPVDLGLSIGRLGRVDALQQQHMAIARRERLAVQLQQLRTALERITAGTYGDCLECGEPIGLSRLRAKPEAPLCRACQSAGARR